MLGSVDRPGRFGRLIVIAFFVVLAISGVVGHDDYGLAWDEHAQRGLGLLVWNYVLQGDHDLLESIDRYHGPFVEVLLIGIERALGVRDIAAILEVRHLSTFAIFFAGVLAFYLLATRIAGSWRWGLIAAAMLAISPRLFAHAFFNSKDVPFLAVFIVGALTLHRLGERPSPGRALVHGLAVGVLLDIRVMGLLLAALTVPYVLAARSNRSGAIAATLSLITAAAVAVALWPTLWPDPARELLAAFAQMRQYPNQAPSLYFGERIAATELPWHYVPVWISITTPLAYLVLALVGAGRDLVAVIRGPRSWLRLEPFQPVTWIWLLGPVLAVIALSSTIYDGWRHLYFIYPALLLFAVRGLQALVRIRGTGGLLRVAVLVLLALSMASILLQMVREHPHQHVYFNALAGDRRTIKDRFDVDYWGVGYRAGLEALLDHDPEDPLLVLPAHPPAKQNAVWLSRERRARLRFVSDPLVAKYAISSYRFEPPDHGLPVELTLEAFGIPMLSVYRLR
jgi:hypothetical protein